MTRYNLITIVLIASVTTAVLAIDDYCKHCTFNTTGNAMQIVKEVANAEYAINGMFKGLHCCAKGYRSIEWFKDNKPYPWHSSASSLILYPESANQTIYTQRVAPEDAGNYTCVVRNDTDYYIHTIALKVYDKAPDEPQLIYVSKDQEASVGYSLRLFCEAFVGTLDRLPDAYVDAYWAKMLPNGTEIRETNFSKTLSREDGQTTGSCLTIQEVTPNDFGTYVCIIKKPGKDIRQYVHVSERVFVEYLSPNPVPWKLFLFLTLACALLFITLYVLNMRFGLKLRVKFKDRFGNLEENDGKTTDVLVTYACADDAAFTHQTLLPTLKNKFAYQCAFKELPNSINLWASQLLDLSKSSRRLIAVLSPASVQGQWDTTTLYEALKQFNSLDAQFTCVMMNDAPNSASEMKNERGETFASLLRQVHHVRWSGAEHAERFWLALRLHLPPKQWYSDLQHQENATAPTHGVESFRELV